MSQGKGDHNICGVRLGSPEVVHEFGLEQDKAFKKWHFLEISAIWNSVRRKFSVLSMMNLALRRFSVLKERWINLWRILLFIHFYIYNVRETVIFRQFRT